MKYCCVSCRYTYDEALGDITEGIKPGSDFYSMKDFFVCPGCGEGVDSFEVENEDILYAEDSSNLDYLEKQHIPSIEILGDTVVIKVGVEEHPMMEEHHIASISIYDEYGELIEEEFLSPESISEVSFDISSIDDFEIRAKCNLHGIWGVKVER